MKPTEMPIALIRTDAGTQTRAGINNEWVAEIADAMKAEAEIPPVVVFSDGIECFMGDGFHRVLAACRIGRETITAIVHTGTREDALIYALGANAAHGERRTNADKRNCVTIALREFPRWSDRKIAETCGVSYMTVNRIRDELSQSDTTPPATRTGRDGKEYKAPQPKAAPEREAEPEPDEEAPRIQSADELGAPKPAGSLSTKKINVELGPPCNGMQFARIAVMQLEQIKEDDTERSEAFRHVKGWIERNENT